MPYPVAGSGLKLAWAASKNLVGNTDIYFRGFDQAYPDKWRFEEWNREL